MCDKMTTEGLAWFRARYGPRHHHNVGSVSYSALVVSTRSELPDAATYLYGRIASNEHDKLTVSVIRNPAELTSEDATTILLAIHHQCEGNDVGEMSAAPPIVLINWLFTLFAMDRAKEIARMLNDVARLGDDGVSDAQTNK